MDFHVGDKVEVIAQSDYEGLRGVVTEITCIGKIIRYSVTFTDALDPYTISFLPQSLLKLT